MSDNKEVLDAINEVKIKVAEISCKMEDIPVIKQDVNELKNFKSFMIGGLTLAGTVIAVVIGIIKYN